MQELISIMKNCLNNDLDAVCAITGTEGVGKSTLSIELSREVDKNFNIYKNVIFQPSEDNVTKALYDLPKFSPIIVDEAMRTMYKRNWMRKRAKALIVLFSKCRKQNKAVFLNIPNFFDLDPYYRNHRTKVWLYIPERGLAMVFMKDNSPFVKDPWYKDDNQKIIDNFRRKKKFDIRTLKDALRNSRNYVYEFEFPDLDDKTKILYTMEAEKYQSEFEEDEWKVRFIKLLKYIKIIDNLNQLQQRKISNLLSVADSTLSEWVNDQEISISDFVNSFNYKYSNNNIDLLPESSNDSDMIEPENPVMSHKI